MGEGIEITLEYINPEDPEELIRYTKWVDLRDLIGIINSIDEVALR